MSAPPTSSAYVSGLRRTAKSLLVSNASTSTLNSNTNSSTGTGGSSCVKDRNVTETLRLKHLETLEALQQSENQIEVLEKEIIQLRKHSSSSSNNNEEEQEQCSSDTSSISAATLQLKNIELTKEIKALKLRVSSSDMEILTLRNTIRSHNSSDELLRTKKRNTELEEMEIELKQQIDRLSMKNDLIAVPVAPCAAIATHDDVIDALKTDYECRIKDIIDTMKINSDRSVKEYQRLKEAKDNEILLIKQQLQQQQSSSSNEEYQETIDGLMCKIDEMELQQYEYEKRMINKLNQLNRDKTAIDDSYNALLQKQTDLQLEFDTYVIERSQTFQLTDSTASQPITTVGSVGGEMALFPLLKPQHPTSATASNMCRFEDFVRLKKENKELRSIINSMNKKTNSTSHL